MSQTVSEQLGVSNIKKSTFVVSGGKTGFIEVDLGPHQTFLPYSCN